MVYSLPIYLTESQAANFWNKVAPMMDDRGCWEWVGCIHKSYGYLGVGTPVKRTIRAHRVAYTLVVGPIPEGLTLDHLCRNRSCVNPAHLEPVTHAENTLRGESFGAVNARRVLCQAGHQDWATSRMGADKIRRYCRTCENARGRRYYNAAKRAIEGGSDE